MSVCCIPQSGSKTTNKERVETSSENLFFLLTADALLLFTSGHILRKCAVENATFGEKKKILTEPFWQGTLKASQSPSPRHLSLLGYSAPPIPFLDRTKPFSAEKCSPLEWLDKPVITSPLSMCLPAALLPGSSLHGPRREKSLWHLPRSMWTAARGGKRRPTKTTTKT